MNIVDKSTTLKWRGKLSPLSPKKVTKIVIHHVDWSLASAEAIHDDALNDPGKQNPPWMGIGYNVYIRKSGEIDICRGMNIGSHCLGYNETSYGIAFEGDYDKEEESINPVQFAAGVEYIRYLISENIFPNLEGINKHGELFATGCPGNYFPYDSMIAAIYAEEVKPIEAIRHWAMDDFEYLNSVGVGIEETRFDDTMTRGEVIALMAKVVKVVMNSQKFPG